MLFRNLAPHPLDFHFAGRHYEVAVGAEVELPDRFKAAVESRRLPLEPIPGTEASPRADRDGEARDRAAAREAPPPGSEARRWYDRAEEGRRVAMALEEERLGAVRDRDDALARNAQLESSLADFSSRLREKLGIGPEVSILGAIERLQEAATAPSVAPAPVAEAQQPTAKPTAPKK